MFLPLHIYGWLFFFISELLTWLFVVLLLIARYKWKAYRLSYLFMVVAIICNFFQFLLVCVDYYFTGAVSFLQMVIILFIIYACTLGSNDVKRLDTYIQKKISNTRQQWRTRVLSDIKEYQKERRKLFFIHSSAYFLLHSFWYVIDPGTTGAPIPELFFFNEWINYPHQGYYTNTAFNIISYLWKIIYAIEVLFYFSYKCLALLSKLKR